MKGVELAGFAQCSALHSTRGVQAPPAPIQVMGSWGCSAPLCSWLQQHAQHSAPFCSLCFITTLWDICTEPGSCQLAFSSLEKHLEGSQPSSLLVGYLNGKNASRNRWKMTASEYPWLCFIALNFAMKPSQKMEPSSGQSSFASHQGPPCSLKIWGMRQE